MPLENGMLVYDGDEGGGTMFAIAPCVNCHQPFSFNPNLVPSVVGVWRSGTFHPVQLTEQRPPEAVNEPVCRACVEMSNERRKAAGNPLIVILPGAYQPGC